MRWKRNEVQGWFKKQRKHTAALTISWNPCWVSVSRVSHVFTWTHTMVLRCTHRRDRSQPFSPRVAALCVIQQVFPITQLTSSSNTKAHQTYRLPMKAKLEAAQKERSKYKNTFYRTYFYYHNSPWTTSFTRCTMSTVTIL